MKRRAQLARAALAAAALGLGGCGQDSAPSAQRSPQKVAAPARGEAVADAVGVVIAEQVADLAAPFAGVLQRVLVRAGDRVTAGQVVAELDPRPLQEELRVAEAALQAAEASHRQARVDIEDAQRRLAVETAAATAGVSPTTNVEEARLAVKRAEAAAQRASASAAVEQARVTTARSHLRDGRLSAPFDGTVAIRYLDAGAVLSPGRAVVRLVGTAANGGGLRLRFAVEPEQASRLTPGLQVLATIDTVSSPVAATVRQVSPVLDPASGLLFVEAELAPQAEQASALRPGLAAAVRLR